MRTGCGANEAGTPRWQAAAASGTRNPAAFGRAPVLSRALEELKAVPQQEGDGADGAAQGGEGGIAVPGPARLGEGDDESEPPLDADGDDRAGNQGALGDARIAAELQAASDRLDRRTSTGPEGGPVPDRHAHRELRRQREEIVARLGRPQLPDRLLAGDERPARLRRERQLGAQAIRAQRRV